MVGGAASTIRAVWALNPLPPLPLLLRLPCVVRVSSQAIIPLRRAPHGFSRRCWCPAWRYPPRSPPPPLPAPPWRAAAPPPPPARPAARATPASPALRRRRCRRGCSSTGRGAGKRSSARTQTFTPSARRCASRYVGRRGGRAGMQTGGVFCAARGEGVSGGPEAGSAVGLCCKRGPATGGGVLRGVIRLGCRGYVHRLRTALGRLMEWLAPVSVLSWH